MRRMRPRPVRITIVPPTRAIASQSGGAPCSGSSLPSTTVHVTLSWRTISGMPAAAGAPSAADTPGTTRTATPAARSARASSPPREATNGSPLLSRTTARRSRPSSTSSALTSSWGSASPAGRETDAAALRPRRRERDDRVGRRAVVDDDVGAGERVDAPRRVSSAGSPGPAPTR